MAGSSRLASATIDGVVRFRVPGPPPTQSEGLFISGDTVVSLTHEELTRPVAEGYSTVDGHRIWRLELLPIIDGWNHPSDPPSRRGVFAGATAVEETLFLALGGESESGYVAVDGRTGALRWTTRTTDEDALLSAAPKAAGAQVYGAQVLSNASELLTFSATEPPSVLATGPRLEFGAVLAAAGPVVFVPTVGWQADHERRFTVRCRRDGSLLATVDARSSLVAASPRSLWIRRPEFVGSARTSTLGRYEVETGTVAWNLKAPTTFDLATLVLASETRLLWVAQLVQYPRGSSWDRKLGAPTIHLVDGHGNEILRRALPMEPEGYNGLGIAAHGSRVVLDGEVLGAVDAFGVIRAFDVPGVAETD